MNKLIIIDGNAIVHRAYHALPPMNTRDGKMVNAVYGFASMLLRVWKDLKPTHIAVTFDMAGGTFRHEKYKEYKATRVKADQELYDQIPLCHDLVRAFNIPIYEKKGFEADDVIGTIVRQVSLRCHPRENGDPDTGRLDSRLRGNDNCVETVIVTGDKDTLQLVDDDIKVLTLRKGMSDTVLYGEVEVKERFGFGPAQMIDFKALAGDSSDNIPGVPGVGEKTATDLIRDFGGIDELYKKIADLPAGRQGSKEQIAKQIKPGVLKKLIDGEENARMSYELATIDCAVPEVDFKLEDCAVKDFDREKVIRMFQEFEFMSLVKRLPGEKSQIPNLNDQKNPKSQILPTGRQVTKSKKSDFKFVEDATVEEVVKKVSAVGSFAGRAIVSGVMPGGELKGLVIVVGDEGFWVPNVILSESEGRVEESVAALFQSDKLELVGHDLKQLVKALACCCHPERSPKGAVEGSKGVRVADSSATLRSAQNDSTIKCRLFDTMIASYLLNPGTRAHDVSSVVLKTLGQELPAGTGQDSLFGVDAKAAAIELWMISKCVPKLKEDLKQINNLGLLEKIEMPLVPVLAEIELNGVKVDLKILAKMSESAVEEVKKITKKIYDYSGVEFNISSPTQLRDVLFETMGLPTQGVKKGKTGLSTNAEELEKLRGLHPIIEEIEDYRELTKLQNTYIDVLPTLINKSTGRIHCNFNQAVTATGRLSSSEPNMQNIPIRTALGREIRNAFIAEPGNVLISADYSQIELRIVASLAQDKKMMEIFERGEDIHTATAAAIHGVPLNEVTKDLRRSAKEINFGILYGMGAYGLAWRAEIPRWEAKEFIAKYFEQFSGVKKYLDETIKYAREAGYCETLFGRRRYLPELNSPNFQLRAGAERMAINHPVQGTAADLIKMAMIGIYQCLHCHPFDMLRAGSERSPKGEVEGSKGGKTIDSSAPLRSAQNDSMRTDDKVRMILQVHDELVFEVKKGLEDEVAKMVKETMEGVVKLRVPV
ncbi:MAG: DNA polymerase I, partial [Candidatus Magasanikbacteria bacterium]